MWLEFRYEKLKDSFNPEQICHIEETTRGRIENQEWFVHRKGRITVSVVSSLKHFRFTTCPDNYI